MTVATAYNKIGQKVMPSVYAKVYPDTLTVQASTLVSDSGGGYSQSGTSNAYSSVPCAVEPSGGSRYDANGKLISEAFYTVWMPTHYSLNGTPTRINLNATTHKLIVAARGNEPAKTLRIQSIKNH